MAELTMNDPQLYDKSSELPRIQNSKRIPEFLSQMKWKKGENILDFGSGPGFTTKCQLLPALSLEFKDDTRHVWGVDISQKMVEFAKDNYNHPQITYLVANIMEQESAKFPCKFDKIFSFNVLHHIPDHAKLFKIFFNLMEQNGEIAIHFPARSLIFDLYQEFSQIPKWAPYHQASVPYFGNVQNFIPKANSSSNGAQHVSKLMTDAGFMVDDARELTESFHFRNAEEAIDFYSSVNPFLNRIPDHSKEEYKNEIGAAYISRLTPVATPDEPSGLEGDRVFVVLRGVKMAVNCS